jgi:hypothetical protein
VFGGYFVQQPNLSIPPLATSAMASLFSVGIIYLTHTFRTAEFAKTMDGKVDESNLRVYSREARRLAWKVVRIECYSMVLLAVGLLIRRLT